MVFFSGMACIRVNVSTRGSVVYSTQGINRFSMAIVGTQIVRSIIRGAGVVQHELAAWPGPEAGADACGAADVELAGPVAPGGAGG